MLQTTNPQSSPSLSSPSVSRSSTFSAQKRVHQLCNHLSRSNTMTSASDKVAAPAPQQDMKACKFCNRPPTCPHCHTSIDPTPTKKGPTDIDGDVPDTHHQLPPPTHNPAQDTHPHFIHCLPPLPPTYRPFSVFAAGSIEMGAAVQWQPLLANYLCTLPVTLNNPRRGHWDPSITPEAKNVAFRTQVEWELEALTKSSVICFFFDHATMSPVTMCELGLWAHSGKVVVCCDKRFWKSGNVHLVCERYGIPLVETFADLVPLVKAKLTAKGMVLNEDGDLMDEKEANARRNAIMQEAEEYCRARTPERQGKAPNLAALVADNL